MSVVRALIHRVRGGLSWLARVVLVRGRAVLILLPVALIAVALAGYGWWWRILSERVQDTVMQIQAEQKQLGRSFGWSGFTIAGFPYEVEATLKQAQLLAPDVGTVWDGERVVVRLRPLSLETIKVSLEGEQHLLHVANGRWISADGRADRAILTGRSQDGVQSVTATLEQLTGKARIDAADVNFILEQGSGGLTLTAPAAPGDLPRLDIALQARNLGLQGAVDLPLGPSIESLECDIGLSLPARLPVATLEAMFAGWRGTGTKLAVRRFSLDWGGVFLAATGDIGLDAQNTPEGYLTLTIGNHSRLLEVLEQQGLITPDTRGRAKPVLDVLAFVSGDPKRKISVPLRLAGGGVFLGPVRVATLAPAPLPPDVADMP